RIEFRSVVVRDHTGKMGGDVGRGEDPEFRKHRHLVFNRHFLAVTEVASGSSKRRYFMGLREQTDVIRNDARGPHARPEDFDASSVPLALWEVRSAEILRWILCVVRVVGRADHGLIGENVNG